MLTLTPTLVAGLHRRQLVEESCQSVSILFAESWGLIVVIYSRATSVLLYCQNFEREMGIVVSFWPGDKLPKRY